MLVKYGYTMYNVNEKKITTEVVWDDDKENAIDHLEEIISTKIRCDSIDDKNHKYAISHNEAMATLKRKELREYLSNSGVLAMDNFENDLNEYRKYLYVIHVMGQEICLDENKAKNLNDFKK